jgi:hypothetical protein
MTISRWILLRMRNISDKSCTENRNTHFTLSTFFFFFRKSCLSWDNVEKYGGVGGARNDFTIWRIIKATRLHTHAHIRAPTRTHMCSHMRRQICNTSCISTETIVARTRGSVALYVHCHSCCHTSHFLNMKLSSAICHPLVRHFLFVDTDRWPCNPPSLLPIVTERPEKKSSLVLWLCFLLAPILINFRA